RRCKGAAKLNFFSPAPLLDNHVGMRKVAFIIGRVGLLNKEFLTMVYRLELKNVSKSFGEVKSLQHVNFQVDQNEVVGLLGDNGAGKSTLIKIVTGYYQPDSGEIYFNGQKVEHLSVPRARELGVETVYQERALAEQQTLWQNIFMGRELSNPLGFMDIKRMK